MASRRMVGVPVHYRGEEMHRHEEDGACCLPKRPGFHSNQSRRYVAAAQGNSDGSTMMPAFIPGMGWHCLS